MARCTMTIWTRISCAMPRLAAALTFAVVLFSIPTARAVSDPNPAAAPSSVRGSAPSAARSVVEKTVEEVIAVLRDAELSAEQRLASIERIVYGRFDLDTMSRYVLARNWQRFSKEQQIEYVAAFKRYLSNNYGGRLGRYDQFGVDVTGARGESNGHVTVRTVIVGGEFEGAQLDYRLRDTDGSWKVIDVKIEGISMVSNFRDQFKEVVSSGGPELLLKKLQEKNSPASTN